MSLFLFIFSFLSATICFLCWFKILSSLSLLPAGSPSGTRMKCFMGFYFSWFFAHFLLTMGSFVGNLPVMLGWLFLIAAVFFMIGLAFLIRIPLSFGWPQKEKQFFHFSLLGVFFIFILGIVHFSLPVVETNIGVIVWNPEPGLSFALGLFSAVFLIPSLLFFFFRANKSTDRMTKMRSFLLAFGLFLSFLYFSLLYFFSLPFEFFMAHMINILSLIFLFLSVHFQAEFQSVGSTSLSEDTGTSQEIS